MTYVKRILRARYHKAMLKFDLTIVKMATNMGHP